MIIALVGNPNSGKTTLFNALTGAKQRVGNWPGVTVERKSGFFNDIEVVDLPGVYSLVVASETTSIDEQIATDYILKQEANVVVNILDASNLERNLYLTLQLLEMDVPVVVVLNMMDVARQRGVVVDVKKLEELLGCAVVGVEAHRGKGLEELKEVLSKRNFAGRNAFRLDPSFRWDDKVGGDDNVDDEVGGNDSSSFQRKLESSQNSILRRRIHLQENIATIANTISQPHKNWLALRLLENDTYAQKFVSEETKKIANEQQKLIQEKFQEDSDTLIAEERYQFINTIITQTIKNPAQLTKTITERLDNIILNRFLGIPIFLAVMYCMFLFAINIGGAFQDFFDIGSDTVFVQGFAEVLRNLQTPNWLIALLANGAGKGINTTVTFIPVIGAMFLFLAFLEDSGYMARAAFVVDRVMRALGLPGKSFVPMIVGFGCNVPAVMATRTLENKRDRILTIMMAPFMSCGARLAIYAVFAAAFFPRGGHNVVFALYIIGIAMAMLTGLFLRKTILSGEPAPLAMELPAYHIPHLKTVFMHTWQRLKGFIFRAGKLIVPICILLGALGALKLDGSLTFAEGDTQSLLSAVGRFFTPVFAPMGIHQDNWPATVGLVTGILAKEVVIGTLNALYSQVGHIAALSQSDFSFWGGLHDALVSIPQNLAALGHSLSNPVLAQAPIHTLNQNVYGVMYQRFDGQIGAFAYLLFVLLYFPCVSTTAAMVRELNRAWSVFSVLWTTGIAYCVAVFFYQAATFRQHEMASMAWLVGITLLITATIIWARVYSRPKKFTRLLSTGEVI